MEKYILVRDNFEHEEPSSSINKEFYPDSGLLKTYSHNDICSDFEYDQSKRLRFEKIYESIRGIEFWDKFYRTEYVYFDGGYRKFKYLIEYTSSRDLNNQDEYGNIIEQPHYAANELIFIEEFKADSLGNIISVIRCDLSHKMFENEYFTFKDNLLIRKVDPNRKLTIEYFYDINNLLVQTIYNNSRIHQIKYDSSNKILEQNLISINNEPIQRFSFIYNGDHLIKIENCEFLMNYEKNDYDILPDISQILGDILKLPSHYFHRCYIGSDKSYITIDYFRGAPSKITCYDSKGAESDKLLLFYETTNDNLLKISEGFIFENESMIKLFSHKRFYIKNKGN